MFKEFLSSRDKFRSRNLLNFTCFSWNRSRDAPKMPQDVPRTRQEASNTRKIRLKTAPKTRQDTPKTPPDTLRPLQDGPKRHARRPKTPQNAGKKRSPKRSEAQFLPDLDFGAFWDGFSTVLGWIFEGFWD